MKKVGRWVQDYFAFSRTEMRGAFILLLLTTAVTAAAAWWSAHRPSSAVIPEQDWQTLDSLVALLDSATAEPTRYQKHSLPEPFPFDPNQADSTTLTQLGLKPWIAQRVLRYRAKGGTFYKRADFKKIYGLSEDTYQRLYAYIQLPERPKKPRTTRLTHQKKKVRATASRRSVTTPLTLDINIADTAQLKRLPGIGSKLSARIVKFRKMLGGYHRVEQLREVYHMTDLGWNNLQKSTYISQENSLRRININQTDAKTLAQHPYISWEIARSVVNHRNNYGEYRTLEDLREVYLITPELFEKMTPYLEI